MKIIVGSKNPAKIAAVEAVFIGKDISGFEASSSVSAQPFSDEETKEGAINRALECLSVKDGTDIIGIGLEGGVMYMDDQLYLCNWGALVDQKRNVFTASGAKIPLPSEISDQLNKGYELGDVMDQYTKKQDIRSNEGAIGIFTNGYISRKCMFEHVMMLLKGQWELSQINKAGE